MTIEDPIKETDPIPTYLSLTNGSFQQFVQKLLGTINSISIHDVQYIALCIYRMAAVHIQKQVSVIYFKSGTGTLRDPEPELVPVDRRVWPPQVKAEMLKRRATTASNMELDIETEQLSYENLVYKRFEEMNDQTDQYQKDLDEKKSHLSDFTAPMEDRIRNYVHHYGIYPLKLQRDFKIALLKLDYDAEIMERQFVQEKPNEYQIQMAKRLYETRNELEKTKRNLFELKQRAFYNKPPISYNSLQTSSINTGSTSHNYEQETFIRRKKLDMMVLNMMKVERQLYHCQKIFNDELSTMWRNHRQLVKDKGMPTALSNLIERRFTNIVDRWRSIYLFRLHYHVQTPYGDWEALEKTKIKDGNDEQPSMDTTGFQPQIICHTQHSLTNQQLQLLARGPTYVPPCQRHVSSSHLSVDEILKKQYAPLKHQLAALFTKYEVDVTQRFNIPHEIYPQFQKAFSMPFPPDIQQRAQHEQTLVRTIHQSLKSNNLILRRTADSMNTFYLGNSQTFEQKAHEYLTTTNQYKVFFTINAQTNQQAFRSEITKLIDSINYALSILRRRNELDENLYKQLRTDATKVKLSYLYFLPNICPGINNIKLVPKITSQHNVTYKISQYLDRLLRPFAHDKMESVRFNDEIDFIQKLNTYVHTEHRLTSTTMFCAIQVLNYSALDLHENMINVICKFIQEHVPANKLHKTPITTIKNLLQLCLYNNIFGYKNKIYTFTKGGPTTSPLIDTLSNIYLCVWQQRIIQEVKQNKELFGRYKDRLFFTWNGFKNELEIFLETIRLQYPQVQLRILIKSSVPFFNVYVANRNGELYTRVYRDPTLQGYTLPYVVGHAKVKYSDWIRITLLQTICYCSSVEDFNLERLYLELTCLINGYSMRFVDSRVSHFFDYFHAAALRYSPTDQVMYDKLRRQCFDFKDVQRTFSSNLQQCHDNGQLIRLHYLYELGAKCQFNEEFHQLWMKHFHTHPLLSEKKMAVLLTTKHLHSLNTLLNQQNSFCWPSISRFLSPNIQIL